MYPRTYQSIPSNAYDTTTFHQQDENTEQSKENAQMMMMIMMKMKMSMSMIQGMHSRV